MSGRLAGWPAMVMTAGLGTRIRPLSFVRAKPAMPVAGEPLVGRILRWLARAGVTRAVLNLHHKPGTIESAVGDGCRFGLSVRYSREDPLLGSAGGPRHALGLLDADRFLIVNGDTLTDLDPAAVVAHHLGSGARVTMAVVPNPAPSHYGGPELDASGRVRRFARPEEAGADAHLFIGVQAVEASVFERLRPDEPFETVRQLYPALLADAPGSIAALACRAEFLDIGTPADYLRTSLAMAAREGGAGRLVARSARIDPSASVSESVIWDDVVVERDVALERCVVADGVRVISGTVLSDAVLTERGAGPMAPGATLVGDAVATRLAPIDGGEGRGERR